MRAIAVCDIAYYCVFVDGHVIYHFLLNVGLWRGFLISGHLVYRVWKSNTRYSIHDHVYCLPRYFI